MPLGATSALRTGTASQSGSSTAPIPQGLHRLADAASRLLSRLWPRSLAGSRAGGLTAPHCENLHPAPPWRESAKKTAEAVVVAAPAGSATTAALCGCTGFAAAARAAEALREAIQARGWVAEDCSDAELNLLQARSIVIGLAAVPTHLTAGLPAAMRLLLDEARSLFPRFCPEVRVACALRDTSRASLVFSSPNGCSDTASEQQGIVVVTQPAGWTHARLVKTLATYLQVLAPGSRCRLGAWSSELSPDTIAVVLSAREFVQDPQAPAQPLMASVDDPDSFESDTERCLAIAWRLAELDVQGASLPEEVRCLAMWARSITPEFCGRSRAMRLRTRLARLGFVQR